MVIYPISLSITLLTPISVVAMTTGRKQSEKNTKLPRSKLKKKETFAAKHTETEFKSSILLLINSDVTPLKFRLEMTERSNNCRTEEYFDTPPPIGRCGEPTVPLSND